MLCKKLKINLGTWSLPERPHSPEEKVDSANLQCLTELFKIVCLVLHSTLCSSLSDWSASGTAFYRWGIQLLLQSWVKSFRGQLHHLSHSFADVSIIVISDSPSLSEILIPSVKKSFERNPH